MDHASRIAARFPHLAGLPLQVLGAGQEHTALLIDARYVLRIPHDPHDALALTREAAITAWLAPRLPLPIPRYELLAPDMAGYPLLHGAPAIHADPDTLDLRAIGAALGALLRALHDLDPDQLRALGAPEDDDPSLAQWAACALEDLDEARPLLDAATHAAARARLATPPPPARRDARILHADLAAEHVLLDRVGAPSGVIDWSDLFIGDIAHDLAGLLHWGGHPMLDAACSAYGPLDPTTRERAAWLALCRAVGDLRFGRAQQRPEHIRAGLAALRHLLP